MIDELIGYYQRELGYFRDAAGAFAESHPKIASRLRMTREAVEDPHVGRLIEAVALMNARLRHKLDDEFPELSDTLLLTLYPHLIQPLPSSFIARAEPGPGLAGPVLMPAGTPITTEPVNGVALQYKTCWDVTMLPLALRSAALSGLPLDAPALGVAGARGVLRFTLELTNPSLSFGTLDLDRLRIFIRSDARRAQILIEQLGVNLLDVAVAAGVNDPKAVLLTAGALRLLGFAPDEMLLPQSAGGTTAYAVVQEHFAYPQKHLFFDISGLSARTLNLDGAQLEIFCYLDRVSPELERIIRSDDFELFATPAINLFEIAAEPIQLDQSKVEYRIVPDARREDAIEVHSLNAVTLQDSAGTRILAPPIHALDHHGRTGGRFFHGITRETSVGPGGGDDVMLSIADLDGKLLGDEGTIVNCSILAMNRDLPLRLPFGGGQPRLLLGSQVPGVNAISALTKPTPTRRPPRSRSAVWKLVGQLALNHLSFTSGERGADALREMLTLYDVADTPESASLRDRLIGIQAAPGVARLRIGGHTAMCAGMNVTLEFDDERLSGSGAFLLANVVRRFLATACALNSFVRVSAKLREEEGLWKTWVPHVGDRPLA